MSARGLRGTGNFPSFSPAGGATGAPPASAAGSAGFTVSGAGLPNSAGRLGRAKAAPAPRVPAAVARPTARTPIIDLERGYRIEPAYFHIATLDSLTIGTGQCAWYGMRRIDVAADIGQDITLAGINGWIMPCDVAGGGASVSDAGTARAWGDATGISAAVVIGRNLPIRAGEWTSQTAHLPGILLGEGTPPAWTRTTGDDTSPEYLAVCSFPTGQFTDTAPNKMPVSIDFAGHTKRIYVGQTLDVALVMRGSYVSGLSGYVAGFVDLRLTIGTTFATPARS